MAGYTSTARQYGEYIQPFNIDMIAKGLSYKEGRYEAADAQIRQKITEIGSLDIIKDTDKSYLLSRLSSMVGDVNNAGSLDLSDAGVVKNLDGHIAQSVDDNVLNAYQSTKQIRNFQESIQEIQKKQKEIFNPLNVAYAMQPVEKYLASDKVGESVSDFGSLIYTPYVDIEGEVTKEMDNYMKNMKDGKIKVVGQTYIDKDGNQQYDPKSVYERDVRGMSEPEIRDLVGSMVGSKYSQQATINGWQRYGRYGAEGVKRFSADVDRYISIKKDDYDTSITKLELEASSIKDKGQDTSTLNSRINNLKLERDSLDARKVSMLKDPEGYGAELERGSIVTNLTNKYRPLLRALPDSFVGKNEVYYADMENQFDQLKYEIDLQKLDLDKEKNRRDAEEFRLKASGQWKGGKGGSDSDGSGNGSTPKDDGISLGSMPTKPVEERNWESETVDLISEKDSTVQTMTKQTFDYVTRLANEGHAGAKAVIKDYDLKRKGKHSGAIFRQVYNTQASNQGLNLVKDPNGNQLFTMGDLSAEVEEYNTVATNYKKIREETFNNTLNSKLNSGEFVENVNSTFNQNLEVSTPTGNVKLKTLLERRGIIDSEGRRLKNTTDDAMVKNVLKANAELATGGNYPKTYHLSKSTLDTLGGIFKEDVKSLYGKSGEEVYKKSAPKLYAFLKNYNTNFSGVLNNIGGNSRLSQDGYFSKLVASNSASLSKPVQEAYRQKLMSNLQGVGVDNAIVMTNPKDVNFQKFAQQISAFGRPGDGTEQSVLDNLVTSDIQDISYRVKAEGVGDNKEIRVTFKTVDKDGARKHEVFLGVKDLERNAPEFMGALDFQQKNFYYSRKGIGNKSVSSSSDGISFVNPSADFIYSSELQSNLQSEFGGLPYYNAIVSGVNKDDTRRYLHDQFKYDSGNTMFYKDILTNSSMNGKEKQDAIKQKQEQFLGVVDSMLNNAKNYVLDAKFINDNQYALQLKDKSGKSVAGIVQNGDNLKPLKKLFDNYESSAYTMFVTGVIEQEKSNMAAGASDFSSSFKKLTGL